MSKFTRTDADAYVLIYVTPRDEANTPVMIESYWPTYRAAMAERDEVNALGATNAHIESLVELDAIESGDDATRVEFTTNDGDTATVTQPGDTLTAVTAAIRAYGHLAYEMSGGMGGRYRLFTATDIHTGAAMRYRVDRFGAIQTETDATDADERRNDNGLTYAQWMAKVDRAIDAATGHAGITSADLADACWWDSWDAGTSPTDAASDAIASDDMGFGSDLF